VTSTPIELAAHYADIGYREQPGNHNIFSQYLGHPPESWCGDFVTSMFEMTGHTLPSMQPGLKTGYAAVAYGIEWAKANGLWVPSWEAEPNDAICYGWNGPGSSWDEMHTGLVVSSGPRGSTGHTIEGNRHDIVGRFTFTVGESVVLGCIALHKLLKATPTPPKPMPAPLPAPHPVPAPAPAHHAPASHDDPHTPAWGSMHEPPFFMVKTPLMRGPAVGHFQARTNARGWRPPLHVDDVYGKDTAARTGEYQKDKHLQVDYKLGPATYESARRTDNVT
jgi:hypothetical protein